LLDSLHATEGAIEIWYAQDAITGVPALVYKPVIAELPRWRIEGVLPWTGRVADAWVAELPFGAKPLSEWSGNATTAELTAWTRRLLAALLEMRALDLKHGRITSRRLWAKGEEVWLEGLGLPVPANAPDEVTLVDALREAAGDSWPGWPFRRVLEGLAAGELSLREAAERLSEPMSLAELDEMPAAADEGEEESPIAPPLEPPETGTVKVLGREKARAKPEPPAEEQTSENAAPKTAATTSPAAKSAQEPTNQEESLSPPPSEPVESEPPRATEEVKVIRRGKKKSDAPAKEEPQPIVADDKAPKEASQPKLIEEPSGEQNEPSASQTAETEPSPQITSERPVVRIDEVSEPAFEVIEPKAGAGGRNLYRLFFVGLTILLLASAAFWYSRHNEAVVGQSHGYAVEFRLEPQGEHAELVLLEAPEESQLVSNRVLAVIPGKVYFDVPGVYRIQLRADGYLPQEKLLTIPPSSRVITVRLNRQGR